MPRRWSEILQTEAKPLSAMGCLAMRGSSARDSASAGSGANLVAANNAPIDEVPARKVRRENGFEKVSMKTPLRDDASASDYVSVLKPEHSGFAGAGQRGYALPGVITECRDKSASRRSEL